MRILRIIFFVGTALLYGSVFLWQEKAALQRQAVLPAAMAPEFYRVVSGYLHQLAAEMLFVRASVFLGGLPPKTPESSYETPLANNFEVMTSLYPRFIDPYFFTQSFLPHISPEAAAAANRILETGITAFPENLLFPFFRGTNFFLSMNEPLKASQAFAEAANLPGAPPMFEHLAALLAAQGGDIEAGLISLRAMLAGEKDEVVRKRYEEEVTIFEQALTVRDAIQMYRERHGQAPATLEDLVPGFLSRLPEIRDSFVLVYEPPSLHLRRPERNRSN